MEKAATGDDDDGRRSRASFSFAVTPVSKFDAVDFYFVILPLSVYEYNKFSELLSQVKLFMFD